MDEELRKEGRSVERTKPTLATIGNQQVNAGGRWNNDMMADYILENGRDDWLSVGHLAKVGCGAQTIPNKKRVRARLSSLFISFMDRGRFLAIEYGGIHGSATAVKVADPKSLEDKQNVEARLERMRRRKEMTQERYERSMALLQAISQAT